MPGRPGTKPAARASCAGSPRRPPGAASSPPLRHTTNPGGAKWIAHNRDSRPKRVDRSIVRRPAEQRYREAACRARPRVGQPAKAVAASADAWSGAPAGSRFRLRESGRWFCFRVWTRWRSSHRRWSRVLQPGTHVGARNGGCFASRVPCAPATCAWYSTPTVSQRRTRSGCSARHSRSGRATSARCCGRANRLAAPNELVASDDDQTTGVIRSASAAASREIRASSAGRIHANGSAPHANARA